MPLFRRLAAPCAALAAALGLCASVAAQDYPNRPVRIVVPFAAGGGADILTRTLAQHLSERLGQPPGS